MKTHVIVLLSVLLCVSCRTNQAVSRSPAPAPKAVLAVMERAADWQLANPSKHSTTDWTQAAGCAGFMALAGISGDGKYSEAMVAIGEINNWKLGRRKYSADDHAIGQTYLELYLQHRDLKMIAPLRAQFDDILAHPPVVPTLDDRGQFVGDAWSWCDALFMGPPVWMRLYAATGDARYRDFAVSNWWRASDYLYDTHEHLFFRDSNFFEKREANGRKVFWSRGNGWVLAGLVRVLQYLPQNDPARPRFETQFKQMASAALACQQPDGLWRASLLDPANYPLKETSGSAFYTYALAWGVNERLLDRAKFQPAVVLAWAALAECVQPDGKLTRVQPIGRDPKQFDETATEIYGVGAFLLAGSEVYRLALLQTAAAVRVEVRNPAGFFRQTETVSVAISTLPASPVVMDGVSSRIVPSQVVENELLFQVDLAAGETRSFLVLDGRKLSEVPSPVVKTFARFVPERMDDFAWESDRIAHRMYGPALITGEGTVSSGVDVWVKRTRNLVVNKFYQSGDYHKDHGEGLDGYSVSHNAKPTRGCGGLGIWDGKKLWVSSNFASQRVIATGPIRSVFELTYDAWDAGGRKVSEVKRMSIDANSNFTRAESTFTTAGNEPLTIGVGIAQRGRDEQTASDASAGWIAYWEPENPPNGHTACALVLPAGVREFTSDEANQLAIAEARPGRAFVYYLGAGWSKSGDFNDAPAWQQHVRRFAERLAHPLVVRVR